MAKVKLKVGDWVRIRPLGDEYDNALARIVEKVAGRTDLWRIQPVMDPGADWQFEVRDLIKMGDGHAEAQGR